MSEKVEIEVELLRDLVEAAGYVSTFYNSLSQGETREYHADWGAVEYLASEAFLIEQRGRAVLEAVEQGLHQTEGSLPDLQGESTPQPLVSSQAVSTPALPLVKQ